MSTEFDAAVLEAFLKQQGKLFPEPVAETAEEAAIFLTDCLAVVVDSLEDVCDYLDQAGMDISEMEQADVAEAEEVFAVGDGRYLIVDA